MNKTQHAHTWKNTSALLRKKFTKKCLVYISVIKKDFKYIFNKIKVKKSQECTKGNKQVNQSQITKTRKNWKCIFYIYFFKSQIEGNKINKNWNKNNLKTIMEKRKEKTYKHLIRLSCPLIGSFIIDPKFLP